MRPVSKIKIAMLASDNGTNVANFIEYFKLHDIIEISLVISNNPDAYVLKRAANSKTPHLVIRKDEWNDRDHVMGLFKLSEIDFIVLAGYLLLIPEYLIEEYPNRIVNIHPALLPKYGGKGMYGAIVHQKVIAAGENKSGITIHVVSKDYDKGKILFQAKTKISDGETPETLATKIQKLEYEHYPRVVESLILEEVLCLPKNIGTFSLDRFKLWGIKS